MLRLAAAADIPRIFAIRDGVRENRLSDPAAVTPTDVAGFIERGALLVWEEDGAVAGFAAGDARDGTVWALFVAPGQEGKGIGRALLKAACDTLRQAGHRVATLSTEKGTRAERHYRRDGWNVVGHNDKGELVLQKPL